jgi:hypothetical protein
MWPPAALATAIDALGLAAVVLFLALVSILQSLQTKRIQQNQPEAPTPKVSHVTLYPTDMIKRRALACGRPECAPTRNECCSHYGALLSYLEDFLAKPHANVGRTGPVCPFVPIALKKQTLLVGMARTSEAGTTKSFSVDTMVDLMRAQRERFLAMEPTSGRLKLYKTIVIGFPDISDEDAPLLIDSVQRRLKIEFTQSGMMIGEFHRFNKTPGLRNSAFYPLQTPIPALAIRFMVPTDVLFLKHDRENLKAYLSAIPDTQSNTAYRTEARQAMEAFEKGRVC